MPLPLDCAVGTTDRFLSSVSPFMWVESNSGVADPGAAAARPGTRVIEWLCAELPDCSSMFKSWQTRVLKLSSCFVTRGTPGGAIEWGAAQVRSVDFAPFHVTLDDVFKPSERPTLWTFPRSQLPKEVLLRDTTVRHADRCTVAHTCVHQRTEWPCLLHIACRMLEAGPIYRPQEQNAVGLGTITMIKPLAPWLTNYYIRLNWSTSDLIRFDIPAGIIPSLKAMLSVEIIKMGVCWPQIQQLISQCSVLSPIALLWLISHWTT